MHKYVFYVKENEIKIIKKSDLNEFNKKWLADNSFKKHHVEVEAHTTEDAAKKLKEVNKENLNSLSNFSGSHLFTAIIVIISLVVIYINS